ncbi:hypothetical protein [Ideonella sp.]|uniref:hypothetical protein n=1 Tax=Ideonella sp. TaxID=1929293 RepID=UPI0035B2B5AD
MHFRTALAWAALAATLSLPSHAALETLVEYDSFVSVDGDLDPNLWGPAYGPVEQKRYINAAGQLELGQRVLAKKTDNTGLTAASYGLAFYDPAKIKEIAANVAVLGIGSEPCAANTEIGISTARLAGSFFNSGGKTAGSQLNDVIAQVRFERSAASVAPEGYSNIVARVDKCTSADCSTTTQLFRQQLGASVAANTSVRLFLRWDQAAKTFSFKRGADPYATYTYAMVDTVAPGLPFKALQIRNIVENCTATGALRSGWAAATFDTVYVNASGDRLPTP